MYESKSFAYLDLQKTGTNFIVDFLERFNSEGNAERKKHKPIIDTPGHEKLYFISVRDPLDQYISLFSFGCEGKGDLFKKLSRKGQENMYARTVSAFERWLEFMLDPENSVLLNKNYARAGDGRIPSIVGFQSFRFLYLALRDAMGVFQRCNTKKDLIDAYHTCSLISVIVRHSCFIADLKNLVQVHLSRAIPNAEAAIKFLDEAPRLNQSRRIDSELELRLSTALRKVLYEREWLYYEGIVQT